MFSITPAMTATFCRILELCYSQSLHTSGTLHFDNYFIPLGEVSFEWPYDPDFESEEYYEHEDRLAADQGYAEPFRVQCECKSENEMFVHVFRWHRS